MLLLIFALIAICGLNDAICQGYQKPNPSECHLLCEVCTSTLNATKYILDNEPFLPKILEYLTPICYMLPRRRYREKCRELVEGGAAERIHEWIDHIDPYKYCAAIRLCKHTNSSSDLQATSSCTSEHIEYALTEVLSPEYIDTATKELCSRYAEDVNKCTNVLKMLANMFFKYIFEMQRQLIDFI
ncbi:unnamed protein product [Heterobilharzia americana]|nr:unnamed protein product [Heterobilharzia americana]